MTKLYQVILNISDYDYSTTKPVFNSLDLNKAIEAAKNLVEKKFLVDNIYDFSEFAYYDREFFSNFSLIHYHEFQENIYIIEVELDSHIEDINFRHSKNKIVWKITKDVAKEIFIKKVIKLYGDNQFLVSDVEAEALFHKIVKSPKNYMNNRDAIDEDANSDENKTHLHYFDKFEK